MGSPLNWAQYLEQSLEAASPLSCMEEGPVQGRGSRVWRPHTRLHSCLGHIGLRLCLWEPVSKNQLEMWWEVGGGWTVWAGLQRKSRGLGLGTFGVPRASLHPLPGQGPSPELHGGTLRALAP